MNRPQISISSCICITSPSHCSNVCFKNEFSFNYLITHLTDTSYFETENHFPRCDLTWDTVGCDLTWGTDSIIPWSGPRPSPNSRCLDHYKGPCLKTVHVSIRVTTGAESVLASTMVNAYATADTISRDTSPESESTKLTKRHCPQSRTWSRCCTSRGWATNYGREEMWLFWKFEGSDQNRSFMGLSKLSKSSRITALQSWSNFLL